MGVGERELGKGDMPVEQDGVNLVPALGDFDACDACLALERIDKGMESFVVAGDQDGMWGARGGSGRLALALAGLE